MDDISFFFIKKKVVWEKKFFVKKKKIVGKFSEKKVCCEVFFCKLFW